MWCDAVGCFCVKESIESIESIEWEWINYGGVNTTKFIEIQIFANLNAIIGEKNRIQLQCFSI